MLQWQSRPGMYITLVLQDNKNRHGDEYEVDFDRTKHKAHGNAEKAKHQAEDAADKTKHQASNTADDFKHQAEKAKHEVAKIIPQPVKDTSDKIGDKAHHVKVRLSCSLPEKNISVMLLQHLTFGLSHFAAPCQQSERHSVVLRFTSALSCCTFGFVAYCSMYAIHAA